MIKETWMEVFKLEILEAARFLPFHAFVKKKKPRYLTMLNSLCNPICNTVKIVL
jgi:hypothetical protein